MTEVADRGLPHNLDAEEAVLGAVLLHESAWPVAAGLLAAQDFYRDAHARIWRAMARLVEQGATPSDLVLVNNELLRTGELETVGGPAYVASLLDRRAHVANVAHYAGVVAEKARLRGLIFASNRLLSAAYEAEETSGAIVEQGVGELFRLASVGGGSALIEDAVGAYIATLDAGTGAALRIPTGFADLDELVDGVRRSALTIVAARPSVGKSSFGLQMALHAAKTVGPAVFFTLEMSRMQCSARTVAWGSGFSARQLERGQVPEKEMGRVSTAWTALSGVPLTIDDGAATMTQVAARCQRLRQAGGLSVAVVDYLQFMCTSLRERQAEVAAISRGLARLSKDLDISVVALSQLSRAPEDRKDKRPQLSDLRESGALEQDADMVLLLFRQEMYSSKDEDKGMAECIVAKQRDGPTGVVRLAWIDYLAKFGNLAFSGTS